MGACPELYSEPSIIDIMIESHMDALMSRGMLEAPAREAARRLVNRMLQRAGSGWVYLPKEAGFTRDAREARNRLIREMDRQGCPKRVILETLKVSVATYYRVVGKKG